MVKSPFENWGAKNMAVKSPFENVVLKNIVVKSPFIVRFGSGGGNVWSGLVRPPKNGRIWVKNIYFKPSQGVETIIQL